MESVRSQTFTGKDLTSKVLLDQFTPTSDDPMLIFIRVLLGTAAKPVEGSGAVYRIFVEVTDAAAEVSEFEPKDFQVYTSGVTQVRAEVGPYTINTGETVKVYALSSSSSDSDINGAIQYDEVKSTIELGSFSGTFDVELFQMHLSVEYAGGNLTVCVWFTENNVPITAALTFDDFQIVRHSDDAILVSGLDDSDFDDKGDGRFVKTIAVEPERGAAYAVKTDVTIGVETIALVGSFVRL